MEYINFLNKVQTHLDAELPMVIFKKPDETKVSGFLQTNNSLRTSTEFTQEGFVFSPFVEGEYKTIWMYVNECEYLTTNFKESNNQENNKTTANTELARDSKEKHLKIVEKAIDKLCSGELKKVVISRSELQDFKKKEPLEWFNKVCNLYPNTFCYCWFHPKVGMWLGATPETLISLSQNHFKTMALAGTLPFQGTENVVWGAKEKEEQQMVVDSIIKGLTPVSKGLEIGKTVTQKAGELLHLKTSISGELTVSNNLKVLIEELHPTPAVCGLPKKISKKFILDNENYNRSYYTGYLGSFSPEKVTHLFVNLRCMQIHEETVQIYVGGGITALSNAEAEWEETVSKSLVIKEVL